MHLQRLMGWLMCLEGSVRISEYFEYSKLGTQFYSSRKLIERGVQEDIFLLRRRYMSPAGLTEDGIGMVYNWLIDKFSSAKLLERFELLLKRQKLVEV